MPTFSVGFIAFADDLTVFLRNVKDLKRLIRLIHEFSPVSGLHINLQKSEVLELGENAEGAGLQIKSEVTVTGFTFSTNKIRMSDINWNNCIERTKRKLNAWKCSRLTIIGKANILRAQIQPLFTFVSRIIDMPDCIEKELASLHANFLWRGPDKERRALIYKKIECGGLNVPNIRARVLAQKCKWIHRMQSGKGVFRQAFLTDGPEWTNPSTYCTEFPPRPGNDYVDSCLNAWSKTS
jgi:hypothetical protein